MKKIRILFVISDLGGGGAERAVSTLLQNIDRKKFEPMLCLWRNIIVYPIPELTKMKVIKKNKPWHLFKVIYRTRNLIKHWKPDIIHSHLSYVNLLTGISLISMKRPPAWIPCEHSNPEYSMGMIMKKLLGIIYKRIANKLLTVSNGARNACIKTFLLPNEKVITLYNMIDLPAPRDIKAFYRKKRKNRISQIIAAGRLSKQKDYPTLFRALKIIKEQMPIKLLILGDGPLLKKLKKMASSLTIEDSVTFLGFIDDPFSIIRASDAYVMSSIVEGLPTTLIEAMACGVPVVSTRAEYGPEEIIIDGKIGLLVDIGDYEGLAKAIISLLRDDQLSYEFSIRGSQWVYNIFSKEKIMPKFEQIMTSSLIDNHQILPR
jgi:glycosyltransferase involved in cell wall biosynthesis